MKKYPYYVVKSVQEYYEENLGVYVSEDEIQKTQRGDILDRYLNWEGILGYNVIIKTISGYYELVELIDELRMNRDINKEKGLDNRVDIDYILNRLEDLM